MGSGGCSSRAQRRQHPAAARPLRASTSCRARHRAAESRCLSPTQQTAMDDRHARLGSCRRCCFFRVPLPGPRDGRSRQWLTNLIPARHFLVIVRGIFLKGKRPLPALAAGAVARRIAALTARPGLAQVQEEAVHWRRIPPPDAQGTAAAAPRPPADAAHRLHLAIFQLFVFGYAVTTDVKHVAPRSWTRTAASRAGELAERFVRSGYFDIERRPDGPAAVDALLDDGESRPRWSSPSVFRRPGRRTHRARAVADRRQRLHDGGDGRRYAGGVAGEYSARIAAERLERLRSRVQRHPGPSRSAPGSGTTGAQERALHGARRALDDPLSVTMLLTSMAIVNGARESHPRATGGHADHAGRS